VACAVAACTSCRLGKLGRAAQPCARAHLAAFSQGSSGSCTTIW
jgi:hypothetical protein